MKTFTQNSALNSRAERGSVLLIALIVAAIMIPLVWATVYMASVQQRTVSLAQSWNSSIPAVEAGIEEAFAHLNSDCLIEENAQWSGTNGWTHGVTATGQEYVAVPRRFFPDGSYYDVMIFTNSGGARMDAPDIVCVGSTRARIGLKTFKSAGLSTGPQFANVTTSPSTLTTSPSGTTVNSTGTEIDRGTNTFITRQVRVRAEHSGWADFAQLGQGTINVNGTVTSFDSSGPSSLWGHYSPALAEDNSLIGSIGGDINLQPNSQVFGSITTSVNGTNNNNGSVGDTNWVNGGNSGIQPGHYSNGLDIDMPNLPPDPTESEMLSWSTLAACSANCTVTFTLPYLTNGAWITTTNYPFQSPPGGLVVTNSGTVSFYSDIYFATNPGPPVSTNYGTNMVANITNLPSGAILLGTNVYTPTWQSNYAGSAVSPAQGPAAGNYHTTTYGSPPSGYSYIASPGIYVFLLGTNYTMANCCSVFPATTDFYYGSLTNNGRQSKAPNCCQGNEGTTNYSYALIWMKMWQDGPVGTNYTFYTNRYEYQTSGTTSYSYYGPRTNNLVVTDTYAWIAPGGDWRINSLSLSGQDKMLISGGKNRIYVPNGFSVGGNAQIVIEPGSSVEFYSDGDISIAGNGVSNGDDKAYQFMIYGLDGCTDISLSGNGFLAAGILAPDADVTFNGGGNRGLFVGSIAANTITANGVGVDFVYDQALKKHVANYFRATEWIEEAVGYIAP